MNTPLNSNSMIQAGAVRKLSEYNKFVKATFPKVKAQHPDKKAPEILKLVAKQWKEVKATKEAKKSSSKSSKSSKKPSK